MSAYSTGIDAILKSSEKSSSLSLVFLKKKDILNHVEVTINIFREHIFVKFKVCLFLKNNKTNNLV